MKSLIPFWKFRKSQLFWGIRNSDLNSDSDSDMPQKIQSKKMSISDFDTSTLHLSNQTHHS